MRGRCKEPHQRPATPAFLAQQYNDYFPFMIMGSMYRSDIIHEKVVITGVNLGLAKSTSFGDAWQVYTTFQHV